MQCEFANAMSLPISKAELRCYEDNNITRLEGFPAQRPDLAVIENFIKMIKAKIRESYKTNRKIKAGLKRNQNDWWYFLNHIHETLKYPTKEDNEYAATLFNEFYPRIELCEARRGASTGT